MTRRPDVDLDAIRAWTLRQLITNTTYREEQATPEERRRARKRASDHKRYAARKAAFFPEVGESPKDAKAICAECPVRAECLAYALAHNEKFGVWGGLTEAERRGRGRLCTDCGETISRRHTYCADCRARRKVDSTRRSYERRKRSRGAAA